MTSNPTITVDNNERTSFIKRTIRQISQLKQDKQWNEADRLKMILLQKYSIQIFCRNDGTIGWTEIDEHSSQPAVKKIQWTLLGQDVELDCTPIGADIDIPLFIGTVNSPSYRARLSKTLDCLSHSHQDGSRFHPVQCIDMLQLDKHPSIGVNRIVFEGWRQILLKTILDRYKTSAADSIIFIAEDDVRLFANSPRKIRDVCAQVFEKYPDLHILSLGHGYATKKPSRRQRRRARREQADKGSCSCTNNNSSESILESESTLLKHLEDGGKIHGSTLIAIRCPSGVKALLNNMENIPFGRRSHFDQFLFHSTELLDLGIAVSDPPLAGWAEVHSTLTAIGSGHRRYGGGRLEYRPRDANGRIKWIRRDIIMTG